MASTLPESATAERRLKAAVRAARLPASDHRLLDVLADRAQWKTGVILPQFQPRSLEQLAEWTGLSEATVKRTLNHAERHGWIERRYPPGGAGGRGRHTEYQVAVGADCDCRPDRSPPKSDAARSQRYRDNQKAAQVSVTKPAQSDVTADGKPAQFDVTNRLTSRDGTAGQGPVSAKSVSDEGEGREDGALDHESEAARRARIGREFVEIMAATGPDPWR